MAANFLDQWEVVLYQKLPEGLVIDGSLCKGKKYSEPTSKFHPGIIASELPGFLLSRARGKDAR